VAKHRHHAGWWLAASPRRAFTDPLDDPGQLTDWIPASVPGCIQRDLMAAGRLPDLTRQLDLERVLAQVDASDWWFRSQLAEIGADERAWLRFSGIDYQAAVTVGGCELGRGAGMFAPRQWEITSALRGGATTLGVRVWGGGALPRWPHSWRLRLNRWLGNRLQSGLPAFDDRLLTLKAPLHFGWDFAPRLLVTGIWDDVTLHTARHVGLMDVWARADWGEEAGMIIQLQLDADAPRTVDVVARLSPANFAGQSLPQRTWHLQLEQGQQRTILRWQDAHMQPWHTHDRGFPHLYHLHLRLQHGDDIWDEDTVTVGARQIGWGRISPHTQKAPPFYLNGHRLPLRGINWVPLDLLPGDKQAPQRYRHLLQAAVDAGVNAIRVWGGGGRERGLFYDLCDEMGLLVWQEMPIACVFFDTLPTDRAFLALAAQETQGIIRTLRQHPSIMLWGGGNEWGPRRHRRLAAILGEVAAQQDPSRRWVPASPGPEDSHNWQVWHGKASPFRYKQDPAPLLSEFGHSAPPPLATLTAILPADQLWPPGPAWQQRKAELAKLWHYATPFLPAQPGANVSLAEFVRASQQAQARALQVGIEAYRLRPDAVGTFIWQWNEPWPAICWSIWPYQGPPKPAYEQIARSYAAVAALAAVQKHAAEIWLLNDTLQAAPACHLGVFVDDVRLWQGPVPAEPGRHLSTVKLPPGSRCLRLHLHGPELEYENDYDLVWLRAQDSSAPGWYERLRLEIKRWLLRW